MSNVYNRGKPHSIKDAYTKPSLSPPKGIWFPANPVLALVLTWFQLVSSGGPAKKFHGVGIGPLSKILAVKRMQAFSWKLGISRCFLIKLIGILRIRLKKGLLHCHEAHFFPRKGIMNVQKVIGSFATHKAFIWFLNQSHIKWFFHSGYLFYIDGYKKWGRSSQTTVIDIKTAALKMQLNGIGLIYRNRSEH